MEKYTAIFQQAGDGTWSGYVPDLPAILAMGDTLELAREDMRSAIDVWMADMKEQGLPIPAPNTQACCYRGNGLTSPNAKLPCVQSE